MAVNYNVAENQAPKVMIMGPSGYVADVTSGGALMTTGSGGGGSGTVTSVATSGLATGGPITTSGTINVPGSGNTTNAATAAANLGAAPTGDVLTSDGSGNVQDSGTLLSSLAPKASPTFTGVPAAPTAAGGTNTTQLATTAFVQSAVSGGVTTTGSPASGNLTKFSGTSSITNGDLSGDVTTTSTLATTLATVNSNVGSFTNANITVNAKGLVTAAANGSAGGVTSFTGDGTILNNSASTGAVTATLANVPTGTGAVVLAGSPTLTGSPLAPTAATTVNNTQIATTAYVTTAVNNAIAGVNPAVAVLAATTQASDTSSLTYNNGVSGIGATFTGTTNTALTIDGVTFTTIGQRLLVKNDTQSPSGAFNGVYNVTQIQTSLLPPILTRALDYDQPSDINNTGSIPVQSGTVNALTSWLLTSSVVTVGTSPLTYSQFSFNPTAIPAANLTGKVAVVNGGTNQSIAGVYGVQVGRSAGVTANTGNTTQNTVATATLPAMTANGKIIINFCSSGVSLSGTYTLALKINGTDMGVALSGLASAITRGIITVQCNNATNAQLSTHIVETGSTNFAPPNPPPAKTVDLSTSQSLTLTLQNTQSGDTANLEFWDVVVWP